MVTVVVDPSVPETNKTTAAYTFVQGNVRLITG